jgi:hypothetical protein
MLKSDAGAGQCRRHFMRRVSAIMAARRPGTLQGHFLLGRINERAVRRQVSNVACVMALSQTGQEGPMAQFPYR